MRSKLFPALAYGVYFLKKEGRHSLQSPLVYQIYQGLKAYKRQNKHRYQHIENHRQNLLTDRSTITVHDLGAGSKRFSSRERKVADIARYSCSSQKYSLLYQYFCTLTPARTVVELGTCMGINSCYLAEVTQGLLHTFEGAEELLSLSKKNTRGYENIRLIAGDISETLPTFLLDQPSVDFAFIDANHTYEHTLSYFCQLKEKAHSHSVIIIGDIHWSQEMERAWRQIIEMEEVRLSFDFYECGVLMFREGLDKQHFVLSY